MELESEEPSLKEGSNRKYSAAVPTLTGLASPGALRMMYTVARRDSCGVGRGFGIRPSNAARAQQPAVQARVALEVISTLDPPSRMHQSKQ